MICAWTLLLAAVAASRLMSDAQGYYRFHFVMDDGKVSVERVR